MFEQTAPSAVVDRSRLLACRWLPFVVVVVLLGVAAVPASAGLDVLVVTTDGTLTADHDDLISVQADGDEAGLCRTCGDGGGREPCD